MNLKLLIVFSFFSLINNNSYSQNLRYYIGFIDSTKKEATIDFELINNLIVIPVLVNNSDTLHFILDSGIKTTIITSLKGDMRFYIANVKTLNGLGSETPLNAIHTYRNKINIGGKIEMTLQDIFVLEVDKFHLSRKMGTEINGLIGSAIFNNFVVKINYDKKQITFYNPKKFKAQRYRRWTEYPIDVFNEKPYINIMVTMCNNVSFRATLLIDLGASDALWLFPESNKFIGFDTTRRRYYVGQGLNGDIFGYLETNGKIYLDKSIIIKDIVYTMPDTAYLKVKEGYDISGRNGLIGSEIIRRFNIILDYPHKRIYLKKNSHFKEKFYSDLSGMEIETPYPGLPIFKVFMVQYGSPADSAGIKPGDQILKINHSRASWLDMNEITRIFKSKEGKKLKLILNRDGKEIETELILREYKLSN